MMIQSRKREEDDKVGRARVFVLQEEEGERESGGEGGKRWRLGSTRRGWGFGGREEMGRIGD